MAAWSIPAASLAFLSLVGALGFVVAGVVFLSCWNIAPSDGDKNDLAVLPAPASKPESEPLNPWDMPGAHWRVRVKQYSGGGNITFPPQPLFVQLEMNVDILVLPPRHRGDRKIVRLQFTPNAPENPKQTYCFEDMKQEKWVLELDRSSGQVENIRTQDLNLRYYAYPPGPGFQEVMNLRTTLYGFPVNWMTRTADVAVVPPTREEHRLTYRNGEFIESFEPTLVAANLNGSGKDVKAVKVTYEDRGSHGAITYKLEQMWVPGEHWWRSYKQWNNVGIRLEAVRVEDK